MKKEKIIQIIVMPSGQIVGLTNYGRLFAQNAEKVHFQYEGTDIVVDGGNRILQDWFELKGPELNK